MYRELVAIDLPTVARVSAARNLDIRQARQRVEASRGRYETSIENVFPVIAPSIGLSHLEGSNQAVTGQLMAANFNTFAPAVAIQWMINPGRVVYDIIASKKRLEASEQQEQSVALETARVAAVEYYDLVFAQAQLAAARQAVSEAEELLRITNLRVRAGTGLPADVAQAEASLASRQQDLALALNGFYDASVALTLTLQLDPLVTLVPKPVQIGQTTLVRDDLSIDELLSTAVHWRPDLAAVRSIVGATEAERSGAIWGGLGPQVQAGYQFGGLQARAEGQNFGLRQQQKAGVGGSFALGLSTFGQVKTATAVQRQAMIDAQRQLDQVRAQVVRAAQASSTQAKLIPIARRQVDSAQESLRLAQANLRAGTQLTLDVLQAEDALSQARVRYAQAVVRYNQSQVNLLAAVGLLDPTSFALSEPQRGASTRP